MKSYWETYKGKQIFFAHYDHLSLAEYRAEVQAVEEEMMKQPPKSVLLLMDTAGIILSPEALNLAKNTALRCNPYLRKSAILGMGGARKTLLDIVSRFSGVNVAGFDTLEQAR